MHKSESCAILSEIIEEAKQVGIDSEEIKVRFLYKHGLLFDLTIKEFAILTPLCPDTVYRHQEELGFRKNSNGILTTNIYYLRAYLDGYLSGKGNRQGDARKKSNKVTGIVP